MQWIDNKVGEHIWEIAQSISVINKQNAGPKAWNLLIDCSVTRISHLASQRLLWKWYVADKTNTNGYKLKTALREFTDNGLCLRMNRIHETPTKMWQAIYIVIYFNIPMLLLLFLMMCEYRRRQGTNLRLQIVPNTGALGSIAWFPCGITSLYHYLCQSQHCWGEGRWMQYSAINMAQA